MRLLPLCLLVFVLYGAPASTPVLTAQGASTSYPHISNSGNEFLEICKHTEEDYDSRHVFDNGVCLGWVQGFTEGLTISDEFRQTPAENGMVCPPSEVSMIQFTRIIRKRIEERPERAHLPTRYLASEALIAAFPCKK